MTTVSWYLNANTPTWKRALQYKYDSRPEVKQMVLECIILWNSNHNLHYILSHILIWYSLPCLFFCWCCWLAVQLSCSWERGRYDECIYGVSAGAWLCDGIAIWEKMAGNYTFPFNSVASGGPPIRDLAPGWDVKRPLHFVACSPLDPDTL